MLKSTGGLMNNEERTNKFEKVGEGVISKPGLCLQCGGEYEAKYITLTDKPHLLNLYCPKCRKERDKQLQAKDRVKLRQEQTEQRELWRKSCGIPPRFMNKDFSDYDAKWSKDKNNFAKAYKLCADYSESFPIEYIAYEKAKQVSYPSLVLTSPSTQGVGKTHLVVSICHRILDRWKGEDITCPVKFLSEPTLYRNIQSTYNSGFEEKERDTEQKIINELIYKPLLVLDDVGTEERYKKDFINRILFALINGRYENNRPIVMTTNLNIAELNTYFADAGGRKRIIDRLLEMTGSFFEIKGESYRQKKI